MTDQHDAAPGGVSAQGDPGPSAPGERPSERAYIPRDEDDVPPGYWDRLTAVFTAAPVLPEEATDEPEPIV